MELTLNLIWLALSLGGSALWLVTYRPSAGKCSRNQGLVLLVCVSIILFPVISVTDDLQEAATYTEDHLVRPQDVVKKAMRLAAGPQPSLLIFACFALWLVFHRPRPAFSQLDAVAAPLWRNIRFAPSVEKRPPPALAFSL